MSYAYLFVAIVAEVVATSFLPSTEGFRKPLPSFVTIFGYALAFYCLSLCVKDIPLGLAYAIWCGLGIILICAVGFFVYGPKLDMGAIIGLGLIILGLVVVNLFSTSMNRL